MQKKKPYKWLKLYERLDTGRCMNYGGLCGYMDSANDMATFKQFFSPDPDSPEAKYMFWYGEAFDFSSERKNVLLFLAAMNGEL